MEVEEVGVNCKLNRRETERAEGVAVVGVMSMLEGLRGRRTY